jgi:hypothetical protein
MWYDEKLLCIVHSLAFGAVLGGTLKTLFGVWKANFSEVEQVDFQDLVPSPFMSLSFHF